MRSKIMLAVDRVWRLVWRPKIWRGRGRDTRAGLPGRGWVNTAEEERCVPNSFFRDLLWAAGHPKSMTLSCTSCDMIRISTRFHLKGASHICSSVTDTNIVRLTKTSRMHFLIPLPCLFYFLSLFPRSFFVWQSLLSPPFSSSESLLGRHPMSSWGLLSFPSAAESDRPAF